MTVLVDIFFHFPPIELRVSRASPSPPNLQGVPRLRHQLKGAAGRACHNSGKKNCLFFLNCCKGSPSISIIISHQKKPVSFHTAHPSISIQKFCHPSNSIQESLPFTYKVEKGCFLKNNHFNIPKGCTGVLVNQKSSSSEGNFILTMETPLVVVNLLAQKKKNNCAKKIGNPPFTENFTALRRIFV